MTTLYVSSVDGNDGTTPNQTWWNGSQATYATVAGALGALSGAGPHTVWVDSAHSYTTSAGAITWNGPNPSKTVIISVNRSTGARLAGAVEKVGTTQNAFNVLSSGVQSMEIDGMYLSAADGPNSNRLSLCQSESSGCSLTFRNGRLSNPATATGATIDFGSTATNNSRVKVLDTLIELPVHTATAIFVQNCLLDFRGVTIGYSGDTKPLRLFQLSQTTNRPSSVEIYDSDLSGFNTTSGFFFDVQTWQSGTISIVNTKRHATPSMVTGTWLNNEPSITAINFDSADTHNQFEFYNRLGTLTTDSSIYADNGPKFDGAGVSWVITTTSSVSEFEPFCTPWIHCWNNALSSITAEIELLRDSASNATDRDVWGEFDYLSSASFPQGTVITDRNAEPHTGSAADQASSSETWTGSGGLTNPNKQKVGATFTPAERSLIRGRVQIAVASTTVRVSPRLSLSGQPSKPATRWVLSGAYNEQSFSGPAARNVMIGEGISV